MNSSRPITAMCPLSYVQDVSICGLSMYLWISHPPHKITRLLPRLCNNTGIYKANHGEAGNNLTPMVMGNKGEIESVYMYRTESREKL